MCIDLTSVKHPNTWDETVMIEQRWDCVQSVFRHTQGDTSTSQFFVVCMKRTNQPLLNFQHLARWVAATHEAVDPYSVYIQKYAQVTCQTLVWGARWRTSRVQVCFCSSSSHLSQVRLIATSRNRSPWAEIAWKLVCFRKSIWTSSLLHIEFREQLLFLFIFFFGVRDENPQIFIPGLSKHILMFI